jgi:hypothetical protein
MEFSFFKPPMCAFAEAARWAGEHLPCGFVPFQRPLQPCHRNFSELASIRLATGSPVADIEVGHGDRDGIYHREVIDSIWISYCLNDCVNNCRIAIMPQGSFQAELF